MVAALSAPLAECGVAVGVLIGTAYLFTEEAVAASAIVPRYQQEAIRCQETVLLETGPGHAIRAIATPYAETFEQEKRRLQAEGRKPDEIREVLETLNVGRLRVASKGIDRPAGGSFATVEEDEQFRCGMYMIGQAASLRQGVVTMKELHEDISTGHLPILDCAENRQPKTDNRKPPSDIAIIGMACFLPGANDLRTYWENVLGRVNAITEVPLDHWDWRLYYDPNPKTRDKICSKWGGFLADMPFDPLLFGMPPNSLTSIEPVQLYALEAVRRAIADAGYADRPFDRERTAVILGAGGGAAQLAISYSFRSYLPMLATVPGLKDSAAEIRAPGGDDAAGMDGRFLPRHSHQRHCRPRCQSLQFRRAEYVHRRGVRFFVGRIVCRRPRAGDGYERLGRGHGRGHGAESVHLHGVQQDARLLVARSLQHI